MSDDFIFSPDDLDPAPHRPLRVVTPSPEAPAAYAPCLACGLPVLMGTTRHGQVLAVEPGRCCYSVVWKNHAPQPVFHESRAYPVHHCVTTKDASA
jgi:hypothetical protein